jgi:hypothetical protein
MHELGFEVRDSLKSDGILKIIPIDTVKNPTHKGAEAVFNRSKAGRSLDNIGKAVKYASPIIYIEPFIDSVLNEKRDTSGFVELYARAVLCHELVHFLQKTVYITYTSRATLSTQQYFMLPDENEACTVHAFFFFKRYSPEVIKNLGGFSKTSMDFRVRLFQAFLDVRLDKSRQLKRLF